MTDKQTEAAGGKPAAGNGATDNNDTTKSKYDNFLWRKQFGRGTLVRLREHENPKILTAAVLSSDTATPTGRAVLVAAIEVAALVGPYRVGLSARRAAELAGCSRGAAGEALGWLVEQGFLVRTSQGNERQSASYELGPALWALGREHVQAGGVGAALGVAPIWDTNGLGHVAWSVWQALSDHGQTVTAIANAAGVTRKTAKRHLTRLLDAQLAAVDAKTGWLRGPAKPREVLPDDLREAREERARRFEEDRADADWALKYLARLYEGPQALRLKGAPEPVSVAMTEADHRQCDDWIDALARCECPCCGRRAWQESGRGAVTRGGDRTVSVGVCCDWCGVGVSIDGDGHIGTGDPWLFVGEDATDLVPWCDPLDVNDELEAGRPDGGVWTYQGGEAVTITTWARRAKKECRICASNVWRRDWGYELRESYEFYKRDRMEAIRAAVR